MSEEWRDGKGFPPVVSETDSTSCWFWAVIIGIIIFSSLCDSINARNAVRTEKQPVLKSLHMFDESSGWAWGTYGVGAFLLHTNDGGATWIEAEASTDSWSHGGLFLSSQSAWMQNSHGTHRTTDGGKTWSTISRAGMPPLDFRDVQIVFSDPVSGWAEVVNQTDPDIEQTAFFVTHDGGITWDWNIIERDTAQKGSVNFRVSTNGGKTWKAQTLPLPPRKLFSPGYDDYVGVSYTPIFFNPSDGLLPVRLTKYGTRTTASLLAIYATQDGGLTWKARPAVLKDVPSNALIQFVSPQDAYVCCGKYLCVTHDGANTWHKLRSNLHFYSTIKDREYIVYFQFASASVGWALTRGNSSGTNLWRTTNGGKHWEKIDYTIVYP